MANLLIQLSGTYEVNETYLTNNHNETIKLYEEII